MKSKPAIAAYADDPADSLILQKAEAILRRRIPAGELVSDPSAAAGLFRYRLAARSVEVFSVAFLTTRHRVIAVEDLFVGTIDGTEVHPREVVRRALAHNAAAVLCAHNHPSGSTEFSAADRAVTARLKQALAIVDVRLLDHFVVAGDAEPASMAARGLI
jgi:DNA repair protein RadC